jgi:hypothetical protein
MSNQMNLFRIPGEVGEGRKWKRFSLKFLVTSLKETHLIFNGCFNS